MLRKMMCGKIHRARVTQCDPDYVGSITIDADLLAATGLRPNEAVHVFDITNGARFETYVILGDPGTGIIGVNGAAARLVEPGDLVIIVAFAMVAEDRADDHVGHVVVCDEDNRIGQRLEYASKLPQTETR